MSRAIASNRQPDRSAFPQSKNPFFRSHTEIEHSVAEHHRAARRSHPRFDPFDRNLSDAFGARRLAQIADQHRQSAAQLDQPFLEAPFGPAQHPSMQRRDQQRRDARRNAGRHRPTLLAEIFLAEHLVFATHPAQFPAIVGAPSGGTVGSPGSVACMRFGAAAAKTSLSPNPTLSGARAVPAGGLMNSTSG